MPTHASTSQEAAEPTSSQSLILTAEDVDRLLNDTSPVTRIDMTNRIASAYTDKALFGNEGKVAEQIFRLLLRDTELRVRVSLAQHVKDSSAIPRDIIMALARDVEEVSLPVLQFSEVLNDDDLMEIIRSSEEVSRQLAIAQRANVSGTIADTLLQKGNEQVAETLIENKGASISTAGYDKIMQDYRDNEKVMQRLTDRPHVPVATVDKLITIVSANLADALKQKYKIPTAQIEQEVEKTREKETLGLVRDAGSVEDTERLVNQLYGANRLNSTLILNALCQGNFDFFEIGIARLAEVPISNARKLMSDRGDLGFRALYNKSGLPDAMFSAVRLLLSVVKDVAEEGHKPGSGRFSNRIVERILQRSEETPSENLSYIIALVRRSGQN